MALWGGYHPHAAAIPPGQRCGRQYRGFAILVGPNSVLFFKIGTLEKKLWFCKVHVLKSGDGAGDYPHADLVLAQPP